LKPQLCPLAGGIFARLAGHFFVVSLIISVLASVIG
jgi:hypothetical protein